METILTCHYNDLDYVNLYPYLILATNNENNS